MSDEIRVGDLVEVMRMRCYGGMWVEIVWLRAIVVELGDTAIGIEFTPPEQHAIPRAWIERHRENDVWRRLT
ncbi:hypothetical protein [Burkholderia sp. JKS000303]|uniref:hypothetical protein n=1 Tax=Burkholderia sp. JKS000303 TaxID=1938747 RepID=UPI000BF7F61A|nr:hypothetical protein [Burkholderia sp. JKS000303]PFH29131.1 hypothetical protein BX604_2903 [Burkholderia sp. JKS000303]